MPMNQRLEHSLPYLFITEGIRGLNSSLVIISALGLECSSREFSAGAETIRNTGIVGREWTAHQERGFAPAKGLLGLGQINFPIDAGSCVPAHTHRASQSLGDFCHPAVNHYRSRAVLFEISGLFCSPEGVFYCRQRSLGRCLHCVLTGRQPAPPQRRSGPCTAAHRDCLGKGNNPRRPGGSGQARGQCEEEAARWIAPGW